MARYMLLTFRLLALSKVERENTSHAIPPFLYCLEILTLSEAKCIQPQPSAAFQFFVKLEFQDEGSDFLPSGGCVPQLKLG